MAHQHGQESRTRRLGGIAALAVATVFAGVVGFFVWRGVQGPSGTAPPAPPLAGSPEVASGEDPSQVQVGRARGANLEFADKRDPTRVAARLQSRSTEPLPERRYAMEEPEAWVFLRDGRTLHVRADRARVYQPQRDQAPESGTMSGNVVVSLFEPRSNGSPVVIGVDRPVLTARSPTLTFDLNLGEVSTTDRLVVRTDELEFTGTGFKAIFNEIRERPELVEVRRGESIRYLGRPGPQVGALPPRAGASALTPVAWQPPARARGSTPEPSAPAGPVHSYYHAVFSESVVLTQGPRQVKADRLQVWAHLVDGAFPEGAVAPLATLEESSPRPARLSQSPVSTGERPAQTLPPSPREGPAPPDRIPGSPDDVVMTWSGSLVMRPVEQAPPELSTDDLAIRATAESTGLVTFADPERGAGGRCASLEYGLTSRQLALIGVGPASVTIEARDQGSVEAVRLDLDLGAGLAHASGPSLYRDASGNAQISCAEQADFVFRVVDGKLTPQLQEALFTGRVQAVKDDASLRAQFLRAEFTPIDADRTALSRLHAEDAGRVVAESRSSGTLRALSLDVSFRPGPGDPEPTLLVAQGRVDGRTRDATLSSGFLEANLARETDGSIEVVSATMREGVRFSQAGVTARADEIRVEPGRELAELTGEGAFVTRDGTKIAAPQLHLDGQNGRVAAFGPWTFEHTEGREPSDNPQLRASGARGMTFDDTTGIAEGAGEVKAVWTPDQLAMDTLVAERLRLELTAGRGGAAAPERRENRTLLRATAIGAVEEREDGANATVESRRFATDSTAQSGRRLVRLLYLEGARLLADDENGTLDVPGAGRLVLADHRVVERAPAERSTVGVPDPAADGRGDTLFTWDGSMRMDRRSGEMEMRRGVWLTHRPLGAGDAINLVCERLVATTRAREGSAGNTALETDAELVSATAEGAVYVAMGNPASGPAKELAADRVVYDALRGVLDATAGEGNVVTLFDAARAVPITAAALNWDLKRDVIRIERPGPIVVPR